MDHFSDSYKGGKKVNLNGECNPFFIYKNGRMCF